MNPLLLTLGLWQGTVLFRQHQERLIKYEAASAYAESVGKPMLVVGGPLARGSIRVLLRLPAHGWGDICLDIDPRACAGCSECEVVEADIRDIPFSDKHFGAVFCSHVLEHMPTAVECERAIGELHRVAEAVYVCVPSKLSITGWVGNGHKLWVRERADGSFEIEERRAWRQIAGSDPKIALGS